MDEWAKQAIYEKSLAFKPSVQESTSPLKEAKSQVSFIARFARPLLQLTAQAVPGEWIYAISLCPSGFLLVNKKWKFTFKNASKTIIAGWRECKNSKQGLILGMTKQFRRKQQMII